MSQLAIIVNKYCNICKFCDVDESGDFLLCLKYDSRVEDHFKCNEFEVSKEILKDTIFDIDLVEEYETEI